MHIKAERLAASLNSRGLAPVYCISGDEPLQMLESADLIRSFARHNGVEERTVLTVDKDFNWHSLAEAGASMSLFSNRRLIELRLDTHKPGREGGAALVDYVSAGPADNVLLVTSARLDKQSQKSVWYKSLDQAGITVQIWPVTASDLPDWIVQRAAISGKTMSREAANLIAQKVEGNLLAARQELEKLNLLVDTPELTIEHVMGAVNDNTRYDIFAMVEAAFQGDCVQTARMLRGLKSEGVAPVSIFGALMWELRRSCAMAHAIKSGSPRDQVYADFRVWQQRRSAINKLLNRLSAPELTSLLGIAYLTDKSIKGALNRDPWELLDNILFTLAGVKLQGAAEHGGRGQIL